MILFSTKEHLVMQITIIKKLIKEKNKKAIIEKLDELSEHLKNVPKKNITLNNFKIFHPNYSYHILSVFLLIDLINFYFDGENFLNKGFSKDFSLTEELDCKIPRKNEHFDLSANCSTKLESLISKKFYVFLLDYEHANKITIHESEGEEAIAIVYANCEPFQEIFFKAFSEYYLEKYLGGRLPSWADKNEELFQEEFYAFCLEKPSLFKIKK